MNTNELLKGIRERAQAYRSGTVHAEVYHEDVNALLSLLDSQAETHQNYECSSTATDETLWCSTCAAHAEYLRGRSDAATRMRDKCVEKVRAHKDYYSNKAPRSERHRRLLQEGVLVCDELITALSPLTLASTDHEEAKP